MLTDLVGLVNALMISRLDCEVCDALLIVVSDNLVWRLVHGLDSRVKIVVSVSHGVLGFLEGFFLVVVLTEIGEASAVLIILIDLD